jgi:hypothetical protein
MMFERKNFFFTLISIQTEREAYEITSQSVYVSQLITFKAIDRFFEIQQVYHSIERDHGSRNV